MSIHYVPLRKICFSNLFDGALERFGIREYVNEHTTESSRCLTDGNYGHCAYRDKDGYVGDIAGYGMNVPGKILSAIAEAFDTDIVSEYEPQYWGCETQEEWDKVQEKMAEEDDDRFYEDLGRYLQGDENVFDPSTLGMAWAKKAKTLIAENPELGLPERKAELLQAAKAGHGITVTLDERDIARVKMLMTHEDDLPRM